MRRGSFIRQVSSLDSGCKESAACFFFHGFRRKSLTGSTVQMAVSLCPEDEVKAGKQTYANSNSYQRSWRSRHDSSTLLPPMSSTISTDLFPLPTSNSTSRSTTTTVLVFILVLSGALLARVHRLLVVPISCIAFTVEVLAEVSVRGGSPSPSKRGMEAADQTAGPVSAVRGTSRKRRIAAPLIGVGGPDRSDVLVHGVLTLCTSCVQDSLEAAAIVQWEQGTIVVVVGAWSCFESR